MMTIRKPRRLSPGAHVRVVSLSAPDAAECPRRLQRSLDWLRERGFRVSCGASVQKAKGYMAGTAEDRAKDFLEAWCDPEVDLILSAIGGWSTHQILEHIPFDELAHLTPFIKPVVGYSDTTALLVPLLGVSGVVAMHGPALLPQFGEPGGPPEYAVESFLAVLGSTEPIGEIPRCEEYISEHLGWETADVRPRARSRRPPRRTLRAGSVEGRLIVANLGVLTLLCGTPYFPDLTSCILVVEDDEDERAWTIDRYLTHLRHVGAFERIAGLVIGTMPPETGIEASLLDEIVLRATAGADIPILMDFEVGHVDPACSLPLGVRARLDAGRRTLEILEGAVV